MRAWTLVTRLLLFDDVSLLCGELLQAVSNINEAAATIANLNFIVLPRIYYANTQLTRPKTPI
ncbi:hypothetical protein LHA01_26980 [Schleiferilactobacillus harbinensis]|nr:hypothetical protein LHA01_26980 [Schleiferilactobacillus harbinensis]